MAATSTLPLIGIVSSFDERTERYSVDPAYVRAVDEAGGRPVILPWTGDAEEWLDMVDGVIVPGGLNDIDPCLYGQRTDSRAEFVRPERDAFEFEFVRVAIERDRPLLAICRGAQVLNVALGGSLYIDLPTDLPHASVHRDRNVPIEEAVHHVDLTPGSVLAEIVGTTRIAVNSMHHQAVRDVAPGLEVVGRSDDGLIEAIEATGLRFAIGVQWHPERRRHIDLPSARLFEGLLAAASRPLAALSS